MKRHFLDFLSRNNNTILRDEADYIVFQSGQLNFVFEWDDNDPGYFRFVLPNIETFVSSEALLADMISIARELKLVRCINVENNILLFSDSAITSFSNIDTIFERHIRALTEAWNRYGQIRDSRMEGGRHE